MIDQSSTHGTYVNGEKCAPYEFKRVQNGDVINLGTTLEYTPRTTERHLPTELEVGLVGIDSQINHQPLQPPTAIATNSFHAPTDTDSDSDSNPDPTLLLPKLFLKPFVAPPAVVPEVIRDGSSALTSVNGEGPAPSPPAQMPAMVDLTEEPQFVPVEPVHMECISLLSDDEREGSADEEEEEEEGYSGHQDYAFPYHYDTEDKDSVNGDFPLPQTPQTQIFATMQNPPISVTALPLLLLTVF